MNNKYKKKLAFYGGKKIRNIKMPSRRAISSSEISNINKVLNYYKKIDQDPPYDGIFQKKYQNKFSELMQGGFSQAVSTGTAACFVGIRSLRLPKKSQVIISPVSDSGSLFAITESNLVPVVVDSKKNSYNSSWQEIKKGITKKTSAIFLVHSVGNPLDMKKIYFEANKLKIKIIEDCSQSPFAIVCKNCSYKRNCNSNKCKGKFVGCYSDVSVFSTMYRKSIQSGGSGGIVFTKKYNIFKKILEETDRGRPKWSSKYDSRNPGQATVSALNYNTNEISSAIGIRSLERVFKTISKRKKFLLNLYIEIKYLNKYIELGDYHSTISPFLIPVKLNKNYFNKKNKIKFANYVKAEGIDLSPNYDCIISDWKILKKLKVKIVSNKNVKEFQNSTFNLFLNENYTLNEAKDIAKAFDKVIKYFISNL